MVGVTPKGTDVLTAPSNHSPLFYLDETAIPLATRAMINVAVDYLSSGKYGSRTEYPQARFFEIGSLRTRLPVAA